MSEKDHIDESQLNMSDEPPRTIFTGGLPSEAETESSGKDAKVRLIEVGDGTGVPGEGA